MDISSVHASRLSRALVATVAVLALSVAGCSDDGGDDEATSTLSPATNPNAGAGAGDTGSSEGTEPGSESSDNPTTFGYRVDGEPGTTVLVESLVETEAEGGPQELSQTWSITDEPRWMLYTNWVTGGEISLELTEGDAATVEVLRGHAVDPDNPFAGLEVVEVLQTVELTAGEPVTVTFP